MFIVKSPFLVLCLFAAFVGICQPADAEPFQLNASLQEGETFDARNMPQLPIKGWYRIPKWFAGTTIRTKIKSQLGISLKSIRERTRGHQVDENGRIWAARVPVRYDVDCGKTIDHVMLTDEEPLQLNRDLMVFRLSGIRVLERKSDGKITKTRQTEERHSFSPLPDGTIHARGDEGVEYDANGKFLFNSPWTMTYTERKIAPFEPIDHDDHYNYRASFEEFMRKRERGQ